MANKVILSYEDGVYSVLINGAIVNTENDIEKAYEKFKQVIKNNNNASEKSWEFIEEKIKEFNSGKVEIQSQFKTITLSSLKYFYNTGKTFYVEDNKMTPLTDGYELIKFILSNKELESIEKTNEFLELCKIVIENKAYYRTSENSISIFSPILNYGSVEYNFSTKKMNKGVGIDVVTFSEFRSFILKSLVK